MRRVQQSLFGRFVTTATCRQCRGEGSIITESCPQCKGTGRKKIKRTIPVKLPAGVDDGSHLRLSGEGQAGAKGGPAGDLYIFLSVSRHEFFGREGDDILYELPLSFDQAALGTEVEVPTLDGKTRLKVSAGSQTGTVFRLKGWGVPHLNRGGRGDQLVTLFVVVPDKLSSKQRQLVEELAETMGPANMPPREKRKNWQGKPGATYGV